MGRGREPPKDEAKFWSRCIDHLRKQCTHYDQWKTRVLHDSTRLQFWTLGFVERPRALRDFAYWSFLQPLSLPDGRIEYPLKTAQWISATLAKLQQLDVKEHGSISWLASGHSCTRTAVLLQLYPDLFVNHGSLQSPVSKSSSALSSLSHRRKDPILSVLKQWRQVDPLPKTDLLIHKMVHRAATSSFTCKTDRKWCHRIRRQEESWAAKFHKCLPSTSTDSIYGWKTDIIVQGEIKTPSTQNDGDDTVSCLSILHLSTGDLSISLTDKDESILRERLKIKSEEYVSIVPVRPLASIYHSCLSIEFLIQSAVDEISNDSLWDRLWQSFQYCCRRFDAQPILQVTSNCRRYRLFQARHLSESEKWWSVSQQYEFILHWKLIEPKIDQLFVRVPYLFSPVGGVCPFCWKLEPKDARFDGTCRLEAVDTTRMKSLDSLSSLSTRDAVVNTLIEDWFRSLDFIEQSQVKIPKSTPFHTDESSLWSPRQLFLDFCQKHLLSKETSNRLVVTHIRILPAIYSLDVNLDRSSLIPMTISPWILFAIIEAETRIRWFVILDRVNGNLTVLDKFLSPHSRAFLSPSHFITLFGQEEEPT
jgi:hypothetical protein